MVKEGEGPPRALSGGISPQDRYQLARRLVVDAVTAEVTGALDAAGIAHILLKGPTIADWLYESEVRSYADTDILIDPDRLDAGLAVLTDIGFTPDFGPLPHPGMGGPPAYAWRRGSASVDVHETLPGALAQRAVVWEELQSTTTEFRVGGRAVRALGENARLMLLGMHAGHHGPTVSQPLRDLELGLSAFGIEEWARAAELALRIDAAEVFAGGLSLSPAGRRTVSSLGLSWDNSKPWERQDLGVPVVDGIAQLAAMSGLRPRLVLLRHELFPNRDFMRWWTPLARRPRGGLLLAYAWRIAFLLARTPRALQIVIQSRRGGPPPSPDH